MPGMLLKQEGGQESGGVQGCIMMALKATQQAFDTKNIYIMLYAKHSTQTIAKHMADMFAERHLHSWVNKYTAVM